MPTESHQSVVGSGAGWLDAELGNAGFVCNLKPQELLGPEIQKSSKPVPTLSFGGWFTLLET